MKLVGKKKVLDWRRQNMTDLVTKTKFTTILKNIINKHTKKETIQHDFTAYRLYSFNASAIDSHEMFGAK